MLASPGSLWQLLPMQLASETFSIHPISPSLRIIRAQLPVRVKPAEGPLKTINRKPINKLVVFCFVQFQIISWTITKQYQKPDASKRCNKKIFVLHDSWLHAILSRQVHDCASKDERIRTSSQRMWGTRTKIRPTLFSRGIVWNLPRQERCQPDKDPDYVPPFLSNFFCRRFKCKKQTQHETANCDSIRKLKHNTKWKLLAHTLHLQHNRKNGIKSIFGILYPSCE